MTPEQRAVVIRERDREWCDRLRDEGMNFGDSQPSMDKFVVALKGLIVMAGWNNVNDEREACAKVADRFRTDESLNIAAAIRARGEV